MNLENKPSTFSIADAEANSSEIVKRAEVGERFILTRHGTPVVEIAPSAEARPKKNCAVR